MLRTPIQRVVVENNCVKGIELPNGLLRRYDHIISTMPLTLLASRLSEAPAEVIENTQKLKFRNTIIVYLEIAHSQLFPDIWVYIHDPNLLTGRITNFRNWAPEIYGDSSHSILALEYWCNDEDDLWRLEEGEMVDLARRELLATRLVADATLIRNSFVLRVPKSYPIYRRGYKELLRPIQGYLDSVKGLQVIGRYGAFKYNNQDHSLLMGLLAAENVLEGKKHDLWGINSDFDNYQEDYIITETGLVRQCA